MHMGCDVRGAWWGPGGRRVRNHDLWARAIHAVRVCRPVAMGTAQRTSAQVAYSQSKLGRTEQRAPDMGHGPGAENGTRKRASPRASADGRDRESESERSARKRGNASPPLRPRGRVCSRARPERQSMRGPLPRQALHMIKKRPLRQKATPRCGNRG